jgi:hypothetical protein
MANEVQERPVHHNVFNPVNSLFKASKNDRAACQVVYCKLAECPLRAIGCCSFCTPLSPDRCPYGRKVVEDGPTRRAAKFSQWISQRKKEGEGVPYLKFPPRKLAFIGDYVYLPYAHMGMCKAVPFLSHSGFMANGSPFIDRGDWVISTVLALINFQPEALFGGVIRQYQAEQVPLFITHIRECDPAMWAQLIAARPELDTTPNYVGRKALLKTLNAPITLPAKDKRYPVEWEWDGSALGTTDANAYSDTWGGVKLKSLSMVGMPVDDAVVIVQDNAWVNDATQFVD